MCVRACVRACMKCFVVTYFRSLPIHWQCSFIHAVRSIRQTPTALPHTVLSSPPSRTLDRSHPVTKISILQRVPFFSPPFTVWKTYWRRKYMAITVSSRNHHNNTAQQPTQQQPTIYLLLLNFIWVSKSYSLTQEPPTNQQQPTNNTTTNDTTANS